MCCYVLKLKMVKFNDILRNILYVKIIKQDLRRYSENMVLKMDDVKKLDIYILFYIYLICYFKLILNNEDSISQV